LGLTNKIEIFRIEKYNIRIIGEREIGRDQCRMIHISVLKSVVGFCYVDVNVDFQLLGKFSTKNLQN